MTANNKAEIKTTQKYKQTLRAIDCEVGGKNPATQTKFRTLETKQQQQQAFTLNAEGHDENLIVNQRTVTQI